MKLVGLCALLFLRAGALEVTEDIEGFFDGVRKENPNGMVEETRIVGGSQAARSRYPYFTRLDNNGQPHCGGVFIHNDIILTAAHCASNQLSAVINAFVETGYTYSGQINRSVQRVIVHPQYNAQGQSNDFAIIKLSKPVYSIKPILLNGDSLQPGTGDTVTVVGVGASYEGGPTTVVLNQVSVQVTSTNVCNADYSGLITSSMFCAGSQFGGKDSCQGDSGGPVIQIKNGNDILVGVVSWGIGCARAKKPGVYAKVSSAKSWIDSTVCSITSVPKLGCPGVSAASMPLPSPSRAPVRAVIPVTSTCSDDDESVFYLSFFGSKTCSWLRQRPALQRSVCRQDTIVNNICAATCKKCTRTRAVDLSEGIIINGISRDCLYLSQHPMVRDRECRLGRPAYDVCRETCSSFNTGGSLRPSDKLSVAKGKNFCDDSVSTTFFVQDIGQDQNCAWLAARSEYIDTYCVAGHPSGARDACPETCGKCNDTCVDSTAKFDIDGVRRNCFWLSLRVEVQAKVCYPEYEAWIHCRKTCENCPALKSAERLSNSSANIHSGKCNDDRFGTFFVNSQLREEKCVWLAAQPEWQAILCVEGHPSDVRNVCAETCGKCIENCVDTADKFDIDGIIRDCRWLVLLKPEMQDMYCSADNGAKVACPKICNSCTTR